MVDGISTSSDLRGFCASSLSLLLRSSLFDQASPLFGFKGLSGQSSLPSLRLLHLVAPSGEVVMQSFLGLAGYLIWLPLSRLPWCRRLHGLAGGCFLIIRHGLVAPNLGNHLSSNNLHASMTLPFPVAPILMAMYLCSSAKVVPPEHYPT